MTTPLMSEPVLADIVRIGEVSALVYGKAVKKPDMGRLQVELRPTERLPVLWHARPSENLTV